MEAVPTTHGEDIGVTTASLASPYCWLGVDGDGSNDGGNDDGDADDAR